MHPDIHPGFLSHKGSMGRIKKRPQAVSFFRVGQDNKLYINHDYLEKAKKNLLGSDIDIRQLDWSVLNHTVKSGDVIEFHYLHSKSIG